MNVLLFSMPDIYPEWLPCDVKGPSLALASIAGNCPNHQVLVGDLILKRNNVKGAITQAIRKHQPQIIGLSAMTFQFPTLLKVAQFIKTLYPTLPIVIGGYHATVLYQDIVQSEGARWFDYLMRGEADLSFNELLDSLELQKDLENIRGLSFQREGTWVHNPDRPLERIEDIQLPKRDARIWDGYHFFARKFDTLETSRGCLARCTFCSIRQMYGHSYREYPISRVIQDIKNIKAQGCISAFFTDDNIGNDARGLKRFEELLDAIIDHKLNDLRYITQISSLTTGANEQLVKKMKQAGFDCVFLGMENASTKNLSYYKKGNILDYTQRAVKYLKENRIIIYAGLVQGTEEDREEDFQRNVEYLIETDVDALVGQIVTPYPGTELRQELAEKGYIVNKDHWETYSGYFANVRNKYLSQEELNFLQWKYLAKFYRWRGKTFWKSNLYRNHKWYFLKAVFFHRLLRYLPVALKRIGKSEQERFKISFENRLNMNRNLL